MKKRILEKTIKNLSRNFPALLLTGPRQVGKTTLLQNIADNRNYVSLDEIEERDLAQKDPKLFLKKYPPPVIIDEVQYAPELFSYMKVIIDETQEDGLFWLTGSQKFHLMRNITETLAGRVAIIDMLGLSQAEIDGRYDMQPFLLEEEYINDFSKYDYHDLNLFQMYQRIWIGSFPKLHYKFDDQSILSWSSFYSSYIKTYLQRDVADLTQVGDESAFYIFLRYAAARTGQMINYNDIAKELGLNLRTIKSWFSILETSGIIYILQPYYTNLNKRLIKTPKLYFLDTGLCAYLTQWNSPEALEAGAMSGAILETYCFAEILKSYWNNGLSPNFYYYRDKDKREIDLIIEQNGTLYPIEIKKSAAPREQDIKHFKVLDQFPLKKGHGALMCLMDKDIPINREVTALPISWV